MLWLKSSFTFYLLFALFYAKTFAKPYVDRKASHQRNDLSFVHTFDTRETCMDRCRQQCTQQHSEDLMMPRWLCTLQDDGGTMMLENEETSFSFSTNTLLISIPAELISN
ncbi:unnamed protein product, partial [Mesorhabditis belari]|uniref:Apple domain-containing protein n=1 Tax=Mesorhabditis belari TaxID=2138241 RepID=A0AAF3ERP5_9BILA